MGLNRRAVARDEAEAFRDRLGSTVAICAAIIVAVRLARDPISQPTPRVLGTVGDAIQLAKRIVKDVFGR